VTQAATATRLRAAACLAVGLLALAAPLQARTLQARIAKVTSPVATLTGVRVRLHWPDSAARGELRLQAETADAPDLGYRWHHLDWRCPLQRDGQGGWRCDGQIRAAQGAALRLSLAIEPAGTDATLAHGDARLRLRRIAATPDLSTIELTRVPAAWAQALLRAAWGDAALTAGTLDGHIEVHTPEDRPLRVVGTLAPDGLALQNADASIVAEDLDGRFDFDYRKPAGGALVSVQGELRGGAFLAGDTFVSLPQTPVDVQVDALGRDGQGWELPRFEWRDGDALIAEGSARFGEDASLQQLVLDARSADLAPVAERYLTGQLALSGLSGVQLEGSAGLWLSLEDGALARADLQLDGVALRDPDARFSFEALGGRVRHVARGQADSAIAWRGGRLYGLEFGAGRLPLRSRDGELAARAAITVPMMGGTLRFDDLRIRPPGNGQGLDLRFGLGLDRIDFGRVSQAVGLPDFQGELSGHIPSARYADERLAFDGGLSMSLFDGHVQFSALALERPFGTAPSLNADIAFDDLDLRRLTEVLDFGSIHGRLDGRIDGLRLVDWTPVAFDAVLRSDVEAARRHGERQRISQRAVQNISSVGDASFATSLQGRLIALFDDFGYARIGIGCRLANEVCRMSGVAGARGEGSASAGFTIVQGKGLPRLDVVGHNRDVDWPTLVERLAAVGKGDTKPVFD
jgi:hypothetical protein